MTLKLYARTKAMSYLNDFKGEEWQEVQECYKWYPSGNRLCVRFKDGFGCKVEKCEIVQVFED